MQEQEPITNQTQPEPRSAAGEVLNVSQITCANPYYRKEIWTGDYMQLTVMSIPTGGEVGLERHETFDQMLRVESGVGTVYMGATKQEVKFVGYANADSLILVPAGTWHNVLNDQNRPLKLYSVYAPPHHPVGTLQKTKFEADLADY
ncbi:MAG: cupin domain-containing protein [Clostridia bacterium]|nr:cupin domain-containing protein [Clostridia bacterium]